MAEGIRHRRPAAWRTRLRVLVRTLAQILAGFFPVAMFALVLLLAIGEWGLLGGILAGTGLGAAMAWALDRLIARYRPARWAAATTIALLLALVVLSLW